VVRPRLDGLVAEHNEWQWLNKALAGIDTNPGYQPTEKVFNWPKVKERLASLCDTFRAASWAADLPGQIARWEQAAAAGRKEEAEVAAVQVQAAAVNRFFDVDLDLLRLCGQLTDITDPLQQLLGGPADG
jgi:hypothetical protein